MEQKTISNGLIISTGIVGFLWIVFAVCDHFWGSHKDGINDFLIHIVFGVIFAAAIIMSMMFYPGEAKSRQEREKIKDELSIKKEWELFQYYLYKDQHLYDAVKNEVEKMKDEIEGLKKNKDKPTANGASNETKLKKS